MDLHRREFWPFLIWIAVLGFAVSCGGRGEAEVQEEEFAMSDKKPMPETLPPPPAQPNLPPPNQEELANDMSQTMWRCRPHFGGRYRLIRFLLAILFAEEFGFGPQYDVAYDYRMRGFRSGSRALSCLNRLSGYVGQYRDQMNAGYYHPSTVNGFMGNMVHWAYDPGYGQY